MWIKTIIEELDIIKLNEVKVFCDQSCIKLAINSKIADQNKHIRARHRFIRELVEAKEMFIHYTSTTTMWVDFFTKLVPQQKHWNCCNKIGIRCLRGQLEEVCSHSNDMVTAHLRFWQKWRNTPMVMQGGSGLRWNYQPPRWWFPTHRPPSLRCRPQEPIRTRQHWRALPLDIGIFLH